MKLKILIFFAYTLLVLSCSTKTKQVITDSELRAPAYPLISIDPYTSGWAFTDNLYDGSVKHWTGKDFPLLGVIKVDGKIYRFMGKETSEMEVVIPTSEQGNWTGKYTTGKPTDNWMTENFDDNGWTLAPGAFGTISRDTEAMAKTDWLDEHIWVRREVELTEDFSGKELYLMYSHDDGAIFYINGKQVYDTGNRTGKNAIVKLSDEAVQSLRKGKNILAAYCHNPVANGLLDFGILIADDHTSYFNETAIQKSVNVQATQTYYSFTCGPVDLKLTFTAPLLMHDLDLLARPVNYISYETNSNDGNNHDVELYFEAASNWALNIPYQPAKTESIEKNGLIYLKTGSTEQPVLKKKGDDLRIDWGYFYLVSEKNDTKFNIGSAGKIRSEFIGNNSGANNPVTKSNQRFAFTKQAGNNKKAAGKIMIGYDDIFSVQYFDENLRPYWNRKNDKDILSLFEKANKEYRSLIVACTKFDNQLFVDAQEAGGRQYAELLALAYRQAIHAHKLVEAPNGDLLFLSKENFSNGSIGTVDITYPSSPLFLYYNPELAKGLLNHIFYYSESGKWPKPFAAHDVGTYPIANGQTYGGDMPIEESGNMLIVTAAIAAMEGNAKYAEKHWDVLTTWTNYLVKEGLDPEHQLCTDDFAGHFAHNANLSIKAIMGIASYGYLADILNKKDIAKEYTNKAKEMAVEWMKMSDDGDHYKLTFDKPGTWSQKYNLIWNKLMKYNVLPESVAEKEIAYYLTKQNKYGLPLDNRETYTKADWIMWTATLSENQETFKQFISPLYTFMNETTTRVPMSDWYWTDKPEQRGFQARSVVGGYWIKMLEQKME
ncbi:MAG: glutaminase domain-containing protein [Paludibacteraceae bacterium]